MAIRWPPSLAVGIDEIDRQHKTLFQKVNDLIEACNRGQGKDTVAQTIAFLGEYVVIHFRDEEKLMQKHNFPGYVNHKGLHDGFIKGFHELNDQLEKEGPGLSLVLKTNRMVVDWLVRHISKENKEFGEFLRGEG